MYAFPEPSKSPAPSWYDCEVPAPAAASLTFAITAEPLTATVTDAPTPGATAFPPASLSESFTSAPELPEVVETFVTVDALYADTVATATEAVDEAPTTTV